MGEADKRRFSVDRVFCLFNRLERRLHRLHIDGQESAGGRNCHYKFQNGGPFLIVVFYFASQVKSKFVFLKGGGVGREFPDKVNHNLLFFSLVRSCFYKGDKLVYARVLVYHVQCICSIIFLKPVSTTPPSFPIITSSFPGM